MKASLTATLVLVASSIFATSSFAFFDGPEDGSTERAACMSQFQGNLDACITAYPGPAAGSATAGSTNSSEVPNDPGAEGRQACMDEAEDALQLCLNNIAAPLNPPTSEQCLAEGRDRIARCLSGNAGDSPAKKMARTQCLSGARKATQQCLGTV